MKHAIILFVHHLPEQINVFVEQLLSDTTMDVYIHLNKRYESLREEIIQNDRVIVSHNNIEVEWGGDTIIKAVLNMLREVRFSGKEYGQILIATGQDMLIKKGLDDFLTSNCGEVFLEAYKDDKRRRAFLLHNWPERFKHRIDFKFNPTKMERRLRLELFTLGLPLAKKKVSYDTKNIIFYRNWFWGAIPAEIVDYILKFLDDNPTFWEIYEGSLIADEGLIVTILMMSPYKDRIKFKKNGRSDSLTHIMSRSNGHPKTITMSDVAELDNSNLYLARKFDYRVDREVVDYYLDKICN